MTTKTTASKPMTKREAKKLAAFLGNRRKQDEQSKAWSDALKRAARLIQHHCGLNYNLTQQETVHAIGKLSVKKMTGEADAGEVKLLAELEATE